MEPIIESIGFDKYSTDMLQIEADFPDSWQGFIAGAEVGVNNRTTTYAIMALLKIESNLKEIWLGRQNKKHQDRNPRKRNPKSNLVEVPLEDALSIISQWP